MNWEGDWMACRQEGVGQVNTKMVNARGMCVGGGRRVINEILCWHIRIKNFTSRDFPACPGAKTLPSNAGNMGSITDQKAKFPHDLQPKKPTKT